MALPEIVCLKSEYNKKYLRYRNEVDVQTHGLLQFSGEKPFDSFSQFQVIQAKSGDGLIHLKSCFNNKYFVRWSPNHYWITPAADKANENKGEWSCTLFKVTIIDDGATKKARFTHVQLGHHACLWRIGKPFDSCLFAGSSDNDRDSCDIISIFDWSSLFKLPKTVAFRERNHKYIGAFLHNGRPCLKFDFDNPNDPKVAQEVFESHDGTVYIKSKYYGKFWRLDSDDLIVADVIEPADMSNSASAMFRPNFIDVNVVALLNMSKTWYCKRYTNGYISLLNAANPSVDKFGTLEFRDLGK